MSYFRSNLPPLDYLLFFEAVARHESFTRAASELNVSQAAVSKRVRVLEEQLGFGLVNRNGRNITLTASGQKLANGTSEALEYLRLSVVQARQSSQSNLSLASNAAVSQFWLTPRINEYLLGRNAVPVTLTASDRDMDLFNQEVDAIIYYGSSIPKGWGGHILFQEIWLPLVAPHVSEENTDIFDLTLLDFEKLTPKWVNWLDFIKLTGHSEFAEVNRVSLSSYGSSLDAAIRGKGIALGCPDILHYEIEAKRLKPLNDYQLSTGRNYFVIWRPDTMSRRTSDLLNDIGINISSSLPTI